MKQTIMLYADVVRIGASKSAGFYTLSKSDKELLKLIDLKSQTEIVLNGKNGDNSFGFVSHYFYDMFDILVSVYGTWELVKKNVSFRLLNGTLYPQQAGNFLTIVDGIKTNIPGSYVF